MYQEDQYISDTGIPTVKWEDLTIKIGDKRTLEISEVRTINVDNYIKVDHVDYGEIYRPKSEYIQAEDGSYVHKSLYE